MLRIQSFFFLIISLCFFSCIGRQAYYVSPFNGITSPYHSVPMHTDSIKSASYVNAALSIGGANEGLSDTKFSFMTDFSRGQNFGILQCYYGGGLTIGSYKLKPYDSIGNNKTVDYRIINKNTGTYFFGGGGIDAGINFVTGSGGSEWRVFGIEGSLRNEFGRYQDVRDRIPDSAATIVIRNRLFGTAGIFTEVTGRSERTETGAKLGLGTVVGNNYHNFNFKDSYFDQTSIFFGYLSLTVHVTSNRWTGYFQSTFAKKAANASIGMNYRLSK